MVAKVVRKLDKNAPNKKQSVNSKKINAVWYSNLTNYSEKKAKCPVTLVVKTPKANNPQTFTIPETNDNKVANLMLCLKVLEFPW